MVNNNATSNDRVVIERLLEEIAGRVDGAIDFWTLVCLGQLMPERHGFLLKHCDILHSLVVVATTITLPCSNKLGQIPLLLESLASECQKLQKNFLALEQFQAISVRELRSVIEDLKKTFCTIHD